jgi:hypothetical protein
MTRYGLSEIMATQRLVRARSRDRMASAHGRNTLIFQFLMRLGGLAWPEMRSRTSRANQDRGGSPTRPPTEKQAHPVTQPCRTAVPVKEAIESAAFRRIAVSEGICQVHTNLRL